MEELGCSAIYASHGKEALDSIVRLQPDVVLTDLQMPEMDGLELVREVRHKFPKIPVMLMTAFGSEDVAVAALREGAASYVPKKNLKQDLGDALSAVLASITAKRERTLVRRLLVQSETEFVLGYEADGPQALVGYLQDGLNQLNFCDETELTQVCTALIEALTNAVDHGNLELDSKLRESDDLNAYRDLGKRRAAQTPYRDRRVRVSEKITPTEAVYVVRDEGPGFDQSGLPDPTDPENLLKPSGRGVMLIRTFMDYVSFSERGNEITMVKRPQNSNSRAT